MLLRTIGRAPVIAVLIALSSTGASAACVDAWTRSFNQPDNERRTTFNRNEMYVICVRLSEEAYVSIWDAPPSAPYQRLYPNKFSHKNHEKVVAEKLASGIHCFGTPANFPLYFEENHGLGEGKLQVTATVDEASQLGKEEFTVPGEVVPRTRMEAKTGSYGIGASCNKNVNEYIVYRIQR